MRRYIPIGASCIRSGLACLQEGQYIIAVFTSRRGLRTHYLCAVTLLNVRKCGRMYHLTVPMHRKGTPRGWGDSYTFRGTDPFGIHGADYSRVLVTHRDQASQVTRSGAGGCDVLGHPDQVCQSQLDVTVYLFYRVDQSRLLCAVVKRLDGEGFLITAYPCDKVKEGNRIWPT
jgi:hypothetical protein